MAKRASKAPTAQKSPVSGPDLVPQPHGGALLSGGLKGNKGGPGRPTGALRARMFGALDAQMAVAESIAAGIPIVHQQVPVAQLVAHVGCPACGGALTPNSAADATAEITVLASASPGERLKALGFLAQYSMAPLKGVDEEDVADRLGRTLDVIQELVGAEQFKRIVTTVEPIWT